MRFDAKNTDYLYDPDNMKCRKEIIRKNRESKFL